MEMKKYKLGEIASFIGSGMTPLRSNENYWNSKDYPWLKTEQLGEYQIFDTNEYISKVALEETNLKLFPKNTLSVAMYGEGKTRGNVSILAEQMTTNQACCNIIVDNKFANYKFVYYWLKNSYYKLRSLSSGIRNNLNSEDIKKFEINLPSLPTQQKIAAVLSSLDDKIALNKKINARLEAMAKRLYDYWFVQFDFPNEEGKPYKSSGGKMVWNEVLKRKIPEGWEVKSVSDVIEPIERGISYTSDNIIDDNGIPMLNLACYDKQGEYRFGEFKFFSGNIFNKVYPFEMFIACTDMTQNADIIGRPIFAPTEYNEYVYSMDLAKITPKLISKMYLYYTLRTDFYHKYIKPFASGTNVKHLNINGIERYPIPIPKKDIQDKYEELIITIKEKQQENLKEIQKLTKLRDRLLPLLMNGQVVTN